MWRKTKVWFLSFVVSAALAFGQASEIATNFVGFRLVFPQIANGEFEGGSWRTTLFVFNPADSPVNVSIFFWDPAPGRQPMTVRLLDGRVLSSMVVDLGPRASTVIETDGSGPLQVGYATYNYERRVTETKQLGGLALFSQFDANGRLVTEASVLPNGPINQFQKTDVTLPINDTDVNRTGIAMVVSAPGSPATSVTLRLYDASGVLVATRVIDMEFGEHLSQFVVGELFADLQRPFQGTLRISAAEEVSVIGVRESSTSLTTLPVTNVTPPAQ